MPTPLDSLTAQEPVLPVSMHLKITTPGYQKGGLSVGIWQLLWLKKLTRKLLYTATRTCMVVSCSLSNPVKTVTRVMSFSSVQGLWVQLVLKAIPLKRLITPPTSRVQRRTTCLQHCSVKAYCTKTRTSMLKQTY